MRGLALVLAIPLIEIALFVTLGAWLGLGLTLLIIIVTGVLGGAILRRQAISVAQSGNPLGALAHRGLITAAGILLILPGFFTDSLGLLLLLAPVRHLVLAALSAMAWQGGVQFRGFGRGPAPQDDIIDAEFVELDNETKPPRGPSKWTQD